MLYLIRERRGVRFKGHRVLRGGRRLMCAVRAQN